VLLVTSGGIRCFVPGCKVPSFSSGNSVLFDSGVLGVAFFKSIPLFSLFVALSPGRVTRLTLMAFVAVGAFLTGV